jgi:4'-phosphopantetheinyl transferase
MEYGTTWQQPPAGLSLQNGEVHVWRTSLKQPEVDVEHLFSILSPEEQAKAKRYRFRELQEHYIVGRGVLRELIAQYLDVPAADVEFTYGPHGKPQLAGKFAESGLHFNLSHSGKLALYAFTLWREVGVDIEYMKELDDAESIAERFFAPREVDTLLSLPKSARHEAFFNGWSRKEAFIKVTGKGVSYGLDNFAVTLGPDERAALVWVKGEDATRWQLQAIDADEQYKAALCVEGALTDVSYWLWR